ncbi:hypothetical protein P152DRAFT_449927 [Eremomyces bilateralis CBS 781.70]|uniref:K Homology domain-containing protein n=1 Tax=Eremomyces bilateralis CBS 781.70 TaxID=1392243 RepID=A0A6G1G141_9PEZI|nr:uncharacterized protein P152DRAFT_449927 [Eremomyces bilateralis CBS 781.70]KAF1811646.1 hypothetical protein P152DRAFT_449927 [Eremomyces bilateralis CBS 781.70]
MHKLQNFTGQARHGWERMTPSMPSFGMSRSHNDASLNSPMKRPGPQHPPHSAGPLPPNATPTGPPPTAATAANRSPAPAPGTIITLSFNVPFHSNLAGPDPEEIIYSSPGAFERWTHADGTPEGTPNHKLPIHAANVEHLRNMCRVLSDPSQGQLQATVVSSEPKPIPGYQRGPLKALVTNVCLYGETEMVHGMRERILNDTPITLRCATVDIDERLIFDAAANAVKAVVLQHLDEVAKQTKADIFLLHPKPIDESASVSGGIETALDQRLRCHIYGDLENSEHAKLRVLTMIDQILHRHVDALMLELSMHTLISGKARRNIKHIESATNTAIYFPPPFTRLFGYTPPGGVRRQQDEIVITGESPEAILQAKKRLHDLSVSTKAFVKDVIVTPSKLDNIILERLDKVRKIMENNGSYVVLPSLGLQRGIVRVQGTDILNVERTVRDIMALAGQFYSASWWITHPDPSARAPTPTDVRTMLSDICINSGADISFEGLNFHIHGSDDAVKAALMVISNIPFVKKSQSTMRVKIELANEHKEFVSGKKNGKINKIMSQSNVQIVFDGFNEYNFYIDVRGQQYEATKGGLELVEQEMPASISFHVPDQYHKRIIGIGGQHIQRIMKKYSVFVKFSNAMDRGGIGREEDDIKVDNVICRTPARNAQNLDLVKQEIMDMVEKADAEFVQELVVIDRLYHRELIAQMGRIEELEKKWNCKINFPNTESASDVVVVSGPEYQVPQAVDEFLGMVPERHDLAFPANEELKTYIRSPEFQSDVAEKLQSQYVVEVRLNPNPSKNLSLSAATTAPTTSNTSTPAPQADARAADKPTEASEDSSAETKESIPQTIESLTLSYTRNNAGGLKDAIDFLITRLAAHGLDATAVQGAIPRPKSDSFEDSLPFFESKLLHRADPHASTDSPTRSQFGDAVGDPTAGSATEGGPSFFSKFRKPGSMSSFSSLIDRRKNHGTGTGSNSPGSLFKHASSNASKASLASLESASSGYRNPWNDSGINLPEDEVLSLPPHPSTPSVFSSASLNASSASLATAPIVSGLGHNLHPHSHSSHSLAGPIHPMHGGATSSVYHGHNPHPHGPAPNHHGMPPSSAVAGWGPPTPTSAAYSGKPGWNGPGGNSNSGPGDATPRYDPRASVDSGRPSTANSVGTGNGFPGVIGPPR